MLHPRGVTSDFPELFYYPLSRGWAASRKFFRRRQPRLCSYLARPGPFQALVTALHMFSSQHPGLSQVWEGAILRKRATVTEALK